MAFVKRSVRMLRYLLLSVVLVATLPQSEAVRGTTHADRKQAERVWAKAASSVPTTSYGQPEVQLLTKTMSVDHFGSVRSAGFQYTSVSVCYMVRFQFNVLDTLSPPQVQYSRNNTFDMRYALVWPTDAPTADSPIFLFCGQETPIT